MNQKLQLRYEEWLLKPESLPGWEFVMEFANDLVRKQTSFNAWIFHWDKKRKYYVHANAFEQEDGTAFLPVLEKSMRRNAICLLKLSRSQRINQLLMGYLKTSDGTIYHNQRSEVFPAPIEFGEWFHVESNCFLLVIHHDGERLCVLQQPSQ